MNREEIKVMIKDCVYSEDGITYMSDKQYNNYIDIIEQLQQETKKLKEHIEKYEHYCKTTGIEELMKENKILRENAEHNDKVVDKINWENQKLKKELEEYKLITIDYQELEARNQKLKKQLEEYKRLGFEHLNDKCNKLENQQKEFIEWLTNEANINSYDISDYTYENIINTILSKYKEIIGGKYE